MGLRLEDIELIKRLKYMYCRGIDSCDIELLESLMTDDMSVDYIGGSYRFQANGKQDVLAAIKAAFHSEFVSCHTVHHPIIDVHDDDTADGHWTLTDYNINLGDLRLTQGCSFYVDRYVRQHGRWLIRRSTYSRLYEEVRTLNERPNLTAHLLGQKKQG
ncbi:MAG: nuclear transport factor 2 family protein [Rhodospirillales bacterium]